MMTIEYPILVFSLYYLLEGLKMTKIHRPAGIYVIEAGIIVFVRNDIG